MDTAADNKTEKITQKVEELGVFFERGGWSPMTGRVFAYLLMCEPPHKDFFEIQDFLKASKSAVSNALNTLEKDGIVDYLTFSGGRRRYFRVNPAGWLARLKNQVRQATMMRHLLEGVIKQRMDSKYQAFSEDLEKILDFHITLADSLEKSIIEWEQKNP
jgi:DNA-binding transcriptional regulator GbsR (MarR family)